MKSLKAFVSALALVVLASGFVAPSLAQDKVEVKIDAAQKGEPISPLIYGQFIEHLGRCIYGGIWAEMLQDRKFFDAPSVHPWELLGNAKFEQAKEGAFVGEASPKWTSENDWAFGVEQEGLSFVNGKEYVGYVWAKTSEGQRIAVRVLFDNGKRFIELPLTEAVETADDGYRKYAFQFVANGLLDPIEKGSFAVLFQGKGETRLGTASLMPGDNISGMRADTIKLLKELNAPIYRWPGGNFVSGYNWKDGIGPRDRRPPRKNPAWQGIEHNDFGIDEFMVFCETVGTLPDVAVNTGAGNVELALQELEYANGSADSEFGKIRAANGHKEPYGVKHWCIGNEMYGDWQIGHMSTDKYALKNNEFVDSFRKFDSSLTLISVGAVGAWDELIMRQCADHMDWVSEHFYVQERENVAEHVALIPNSIRRIADAHRKYRKEFKELEGKDIRIAMDEWNYWYGPHVFGELGTRYFMKDGLGIAAGLHEYYRNSDIFVMANYAQTVNVIGAIKTSATNARFETTGLVLKLYRNEFGEIPLKVEAPKPFDVAAATTADGKYLTVAVVNPTDKAEKFSFGVDLKLAKSAKRFVIANSDPKAFNDPDSEQKIDIVESSVDDFAQGVEIAPYSATLFKAEIER
ncbi:MAG: hypothetical protein IJM30_03075 [Thermoguttaceae bacterium]|nr:hypothetical protein [Thermoguttaceae bacterium]